MTLHNQTDPAWATQDGVALGTGILVFGLPGQTLRTEFQPDLPYELVRHLAAGALAFKWVPHAVASLEELRHSRCLGLSCVQRCAKPGCLCIADACTRPADGDGAGWDRYSGPVSGYEKAVPVLAGQGAMIR